MMREFRLLGLFVLIVVLPCLSQSMDNPSGQSAGAPNIAVDCSDPLQSSRAECMALQDQTSRGAPIPAPAGSSVPQLKSPSDLNQNQYPAGANPPNPSQTAKPSSSIVPQTEFE